MKRRDFVKQTLGASAGAFALRRAGRWMDRNEAGGLLAAVTEANDRQVGALLDGYERLLEDAYRSRGRSGFIMALSAAFAAEGSSYYRSTHLIAPMEHVAAALLRNQHPDGTFDSGNLQSPPDTAFMVEQFCRAQALLQREGGAETARLRQSLQAIILKAGEALTTGGVHTPNHRWAVCAALARTYSLYPDQKYVGRVDDWLGEGVDQDADGQYSERSPNYSAHVVNPGLLDVALLLDRPELLDFIRRNLEMTLYHTEPNGEVETVASRRQDQGRLKFIHEYYLPYRYLAIRDGNGRFARVAADIEANHMALLAQHLPDFLLFPELTRPLPPLAALPDDYARHFPGSGLVRIRRGVVTAAVFGGTDWHLGHGVWSGLSTNPTFFKLRKGEAILESVRMSPAFFSTGYFRSDGLVVQEEGTYLLREERRVPYHQPLPGRYRNERGDYALSPDGRFFSKMDFANRPKDYKTLRSEVTVREKGGSGAFELDVVVAEQPGVAVTIELCFRRGGRLTGITPREGDEDGYFLAEGYGTYQVGSDTITFGPGSLAHTRFVMHGEQYAVHNGSLPAEGYRVYITGTTPFRHTLQIG